MVLAGQWHRLVQEEAFVARTAEVGDATGPTVTAARLIRDMLRLALGDGRPPRSAGVRRGMELVVVRAIRCGGRADTALDRR